MKLFNGEEVDDFAYKIGYEYFKKHPNKNEPISKCNPFNHQSNKYFSWIKGNEDAFNEHLNNKNKDNN